VKPTYKGTARDWNIFRCRQIIFIRCIRCESSGLQILWIVNVLR
jgi:hypothetical protein